MVFKNKHLVSNNLSVPPDTLFVVAQTPKTIGDQIVISIDPEETAAIRRKHLAVYPHQLMIDDIRAGKYQDKGLWLLSGGALVMDEQNRIALGLRDGNSTDPFTFTNIGAGRCDQRLGTHSKQELASELVLCVRTPEGWHQVDLGCGTRPLNELYDQQALPAVRESMKEIVESGLTFGITPSPTTKAAGLPGASDRIKVEWSAACQDEQLLGYVWHDMKNHTLEFRLAVQFDLSDYDDTRIFYSEGTGYAVWKSTREIRELVSAQGRWGHRLVTPFLENLATQ